MKSSSSAISSFGILVREKLI